MKILLKTAFNPFSGYGNDGIGICQALLEAGLDLYLDPSFVAPPLPPTVASLFTKPLNPPFDLLIHHADPGQIGLTKQARVAVATTVAWTMWEYSSMDNLRGKSTLRKRLRDYDVVLGYDRVSTAALTPYVTGPADNLTTLQGGFWPQQWPAQHRDWHSPRFGFFMEGQLHERKDPFVAIQAFRELKTELPEEFDGAELHLKTNTPGLHSAMEQWVPKLRVHYAMWPEDTLRQFYAAQHCLLAPSRGEGKNLPALQFLSTGGTVIATNWGGHTGWLSPAYAYPLDYQLRPIELSKPNCCNARADKDHLKALMLHVYRNRAEAARKGEIAARTIPLMCSWKAVLARLFDKLPDLVPNGGALAHAARVGTAQRTQEPSRG